MKVLKDGIYQVTPNLQLRKLDSLKERIIDLFKTYQEPEFDKNGKFIPKKIRKAYVNNDEDKDEQDIAEADIQIAEDQDIIDELR